jgi:putative transport protein
VDARAAAREYEKEHGVASGDTPALSGWTTGGLRAYQLENQAWQGRTIGEFLRENREYRVVNVVRNGESKPPSDMLTLQHGDIIALGGRRETLTEKMGLIGPEVSDRKALDIPLDRAEILVTNSEMLQKTRDEWRALPGIDQLQVVGLERGGVPLPSIRTLTNEASPRFSPRSAARRSRRCDTCI